MTTTFRPTERDQDQEVGRDRLGDLVLAVAIVVVALPTLYYAVAQMRAGWVPVNDDAIIYTRTLDVLSDTPPLVGQYTQASDGLDLEQATYSPGPLAYQVLALPSWALPPWTVPGVVGLLSAGSFAAVLVLVRRRGGTGLVAVTALGLVGLQRALDLRTFVETWNPFFALAPFVLLLVVCWSVAAGDRWLLPLAIFLFSLVGQAHLTYVAPGLAALVVALVGGWGSDVAGAVRAWWVRRSPSSGGTDDAPADTGARFVGDPSRWRRFLGSAWAPILVATVVGLLCWAAPLYQQVTGSPGNLSQVIESNRGDREHFGPEIANSAFVDAYGVPPSFLFRNDDAKFFLTDAIEMDAVSVVGTFVVLAVVVAVGVVALRRRDRSLAAGAALVLAVAPTLWWIVAAFPTDRALASGYSFRWFVVAGMLTWLVAGWGLARLWGEAVVARLFARTDGVPAHLALVSTTIVLLLAVGVVVAAVRQPHEQEARLRSTYAAANELGDALDGATSRGGRYRVEPSSVFRYTLDPAMIARLRRTGRVPVLGDERVMNWGHRYRASGVRCDGVIRVLGPTDELPGGTVVGTSSMLVGEEEVEARLAVAADTDAGTC